MVRETTPGAGRFHLSPVRHPRPGRAEPKSPPCRASSNGRSDHAGRRWKRAVAGLGIPAVLLFGIPLEKDPVGLENFAPDGIVQQAIRAIKDAVPEMVVITDVCLCEYTDHGHCGIVNVGGDRPARPAPAGRLPAERRDPGDPGEGGRLARRGRGRHRGAFRHDGRHGGAIRGGPGRGAGSSTLPILSYSTKYASGFYGPFRDAAQGAPKFGDRRSHQMDPANVREALREAALDVAEGADMLMVKPALPYLDVIRSRARAFPQLPLVAYNVSGEYAMVKAAGANGWLDEERAVLEMLTGIKRAGADLIITYHAKEAAQWLD